MQKIFEICKKILKKLLTNQLKYDIINTERKKERETLKN